MDQTTVLTAIDGFRSQRSSRNMRNTQARDLREFFISQLIFFGQANCCFVGL